MESEPAAAEGSVVKEAVDISPRTFVLGAPASYEFLSNELHRAQVEADQLKEQLREKASPPRPQPRGRPFKGCTWDGSARDALGSKGLWRRAGNRCASACRAE